MRLMKQCGFPSAASVLESREKKLVGQGKVSVSVSNTVTPLYNPHHSRADEGSEEAVVRNAIEEHHAIRGNDRGGGLERRHVQCGP